MKYLMAWKVENADFYKTPIYLKYGIDICNQEIYTQFFYTNMLVNEKYTIINALQKPCWKVFEKIDYQNLNILISELEDYIKVINSENGKETVNTLLKYSKEAQLESKNIVITGD